MKPKIIEILNKHKDDFVSMTDVIVDSEFESIAEEIVKLFAIPVVSRSLLRSKAKDYAKLLHQDEYSDPIYQRDVLETITNFEAGYLAAIEYSNDG